MFTGIVEHQGLVAALRQEPWGARLEVDPCGWPHAPRDGDSIAVNGCCLTVVGTPVAGGPLRFDVVPQTLGLTTVGALRAGDRVNLEHAATASTLLGGHLVQGHVDGIGEVLAVSEAGGEWRTRGGPGSDGPRKSERGPGEQRILGLATRHTPHATHSRHTPLIEDTFAHLYLFRPSVRFRSLVGLWPVSGGGRALCAMEPA